jgi:hypothetical protein
VLVSEPRLDADARRLLETCLDSFEKLELVRVLRAAGGALSRSDLEEKCQFGSDTVQETLRSLSAMRVVELDEGEKRVRLGPSSEAPAFRAVTEVYENDRMVVLSILSTIAMERIRNMASRAFADAFVLRKKRGDDNG